MRLSLEATSIAADVALFAVSVTSDGSWSYQSRAVESARGHLSQGDRAQLISLFEKVPWDQEVLNGDIRHDDRTLYRLEIAFPSGEHRLYQFSETMDQRSYELRDLVHFLRHNVAVGGDPPGTVRPGTAQEPHDHLHP